MLPMLAYDVLLRDYPLLLLYEVLHQPLHSCHHTNIHEDMKNVISLNFLFYMNYALKCYELFYTYY